MTFPARESVFHGIGHQFSDKKRQGDCEIQVYVQRIGANAHTHAMRYVAFLNVVYECP